MSSNKESTVNLLEFLPVSAIAVDLKGETKKEIFQEMVQVLTAAHNIKNSEKILDALVERENLGSTGIGMGIAIPHGKSDSVNNVIAALGISKKGVNFDSLDGEPAHLFFTLVAPTNSSGLHLKILAKISRLLKDKLFREGLRQAINAEEVIRKIKTESELA